MAGRNTRPFQRYPALLGRLVHDGLGLGRVEGLTQRIDALQSLLLEDVEQGVADLLETAARLVADPVGPGQVDGIEDGQQLRDQILGGPLEVLGLLLDHALLVVLEVRLQPPQRVEVLVPLGRDALQVGQVGADGLLVVLVTGSHALGVPRFHRVGAGVVRSFRNVMRECQRFRGLA